MCVSLSQVHAVQRRRRRSYPISLAREGWRYGTCSSQVGIMRIGFDWLAYVCAGSMRMRWLVSRRSVSLTHRSSRRSSCCRSALSGFGGGCFELRDRHARRRSHAAWSPILISRFHSGRRQLHPTSALDRTISKHVRPLAGYSPRGCDLKRLRDGTIGLLRLRRDAGHHHLPELSRRTCGDHVVGLLGRAAFHGCDWPRRCLSRGANDRWRTPVDGGHYRSRRHRRHIASPSPAMCGRTARPSVGGPPGHVTASPFRRLREASAR